ncbi:MAG: GNAT family N-acetyltransferase [Sphingobacteriaceae bacterium]|nr:GNAT family N-acetyltransferase [Cytophagaceae bacterium]
MISVELVTDEDSLNQIFTIRNIVFVQEQQVPEEEEYDEFERTSRHFLARLGKESCGTARWRFTEKGVKMERFAVLSDFRSQGVGSALVKALLDDILAQPTLEGRPIYLHAQVSAMPLYSKFGFQSEGALFYDCEIPHFKMTWMP